MKDLFSFQAKDYATYRPRYPESLYQFILSHVSRFDCAWDCATGNGQVAVVLSRSFREVYATDISSSQLKYAQGAPNLFYSIRPAETFGIGGAPNGAFQNNCFDLVTVGQALHWLNLNPFYQELDRVLRPGGVFAAFGYSICTISPAIDEIITAFYSQTVGPYWDPARNLVENKYQTLPFPFIEKEAPLFYQVLEWDLQHLQGYLSSWSATQAFIKKEGYDPLPAVIQKLKNLWKEDLKLQVTFPIFMRLSIKP